MDGVEAAVDAGDVITGTTSNGVGLIVARSDEVVAGLAVHGVRTAVALQLVAAATTEQGVITAVTLQVVEFCAAVDEVVSAAPGK